MTDVFGLSDIALWSIIIGFVAPLVIAFVARPTLKPWAKIGIQVVFCLIVGTFTAYLYGQLNGREIISAILLILAVSILAYKGFWKPTGVADKIESGILAGEVDAAVATSDSPAAGDLPDADDVDPQDLVDVPDDGVIQGK